MLALVMGSVMYLVAAQATITGPTIAFKDCLKATSAKAKNEKVATANYEAYARNACSAQLAGLTNAITSFNVKNGMKRKDAADDAELTAGDYLTSSVDKYQYLAGVDAENDKAVADSKAKAAAAAAATPPATAAAAPQEPK